MNTSQTEKTKIKWKYVKGKKFEKVLSLFIDYNMESQQFKLNNEEYEIIWQGSEYSLLLVKGIDREKGVYIISEIPMEPWKMEALAKTLLKRHPELIKKL